MRNISHKRCRENQNTHFVFNKLFMKIVSFIRWKNIVERGRPQTAIWPMRIACWIPKVTNTNSVYAILMAFPLHQCSALRYTIYCLSCCCLHGQKYSHITEGLYSVQWRRIVSVGSGRGIVVRFLVGTRCFDVLSNVQTQFRAHPVSCLMRIGPRFILRLTQVADHAPPSSAEGENENLTLFTPSS